MTKWKHLLVNWTTPAKLTRISGVRYWQERIIQTLLLVSSVFGFFVWLPSVALSIKENLWIIAVLDTLIYAWILSLTFYRRLSYTLRSISFICISYCLGLVLIWVLGPYGAGPVWLFAFPVLAGLLMGLRASLTALAINGVTLISVGLALTLDSVLSWQYAGLANPAEKWIVSGLNFMLLNTIVTLSVTTVLHGLQNSVDALNISNEKFQRIYNNILDVYFETTMDGTITQISPSVTTISRYSQEDLISTHVSTLYRDLSQRDLILDQLLKNGHVQNFELDLTDRDGEVHHCSINARLMVNATGNPTGIVGSCRDISNEKKIELEKQELEQRLSRSRKMEALGLLAGGVAHDLNNILSGILGYPELILMDLPDDSPIRETVLAIQQTGRKAAEIVQDLLTLSRRGIIQKKPVNINEVITTFLKTPEFKKIKSYHPDIDVKRQLDARHPFVSGSLVHLTKTVMNLISNAAEAQPLGGTISISTRNVHMDYAVTGYMLIPPGNYVALMIEDEGTGIAEEDLDRIFEPFFTKKVMGRSGTGLGMAVVWGTVQDHDGYIDVHTREGMGTLFTLYFPQTAGGDQSPPRPMDLTTITGNQERILVVDDLELQRHINAAMLRRLNYTVDTVSSGEAAIEYLKIFQADLILLDMIMAPGIDGLETYKRILEVRPGQKTIIMSGYSETDAIRQVRKLGVSDYVKKPFDIETIGIVVKKALSSS